ncbi:MAG: hypothetical protein L6Q99_15030 [Planctomycetes bacterium]|nr:hypothetical protein [Planctomycetota bacterium]
MDVNDWIGVASVLACLGVTSCVTQAPSARTNADEQARERSVAHDGSSDVEEREAVTPRIVVTENGREIDVRWLALTARDSRNSEFVLCYEPADGVSGGRDCFADLGEFETSSWGGHLVDGEGWHQCVWLDASALSFVADATKLVPALYVDRPVDLEARCWLEKDTFQLGEGVRVNWSFTNRGNEIVRWKKSSAHGSFKSPCAYELQRDGGEVAPRAFRGGGGGNRLSTENELAPGATLDHYERLDWKYPLDESGVYALRASFSIAVVDPAPRYERLRLSDRAGGL